MIHVDTHVLVWIAAGLIDRLPSRLADRLPSLPVRFSPMVALELGYLHEVGRLNEPADVVLSRLTSRLDLRMAEAAFPRVALRAASLTWTRDPFDRLIAAGALVDDVPLLTADRRMLQHCPVAAWDDWR